MNTVQAKLYAKLFCRDQLKDRLSDIEAIIEKIGKSPYSSHLSSHLFELSVHDKKNGFNLLHLNFYKRDLSARTIRKISFYRAKKIISNIQFLNRRSKNRFDLKTAVKVLNLFVASDRPIQFGADFNSRFNKVKIYLSLQKGDQSLALNNIVLLSQMLGLDPKGILKKFCKENFDSLGVDFLSSGQANLKIYTCDLASTSNIAKVKATYLGKKKMNLLTRQFFHNFEKLSLKDVGLLYRIDKKSLIDSIKIWGRLKTMIPLKIHPMINIKISYVALENHNHQFYFR